MGSQLKQVTPSCMNIFIWGIWRQSRNCLLTLGSENGENLLQMLRYDGMTHLSILVGCGSNPGIHVVDVIGWANNLGGTSVNDGLAATSAGHSLSIDGDTGRRNRRKSITAKLINLCLCLVLCVLCFLGTCPFGSASRWQRSEGSMWFDRCNGYCQYHQRPPHCPAHYCWERETIITDMRCQTGNDVTGNTLPSSFSTRSGRRRTGTGKQVPAWPCCQRQAQHCQRRCSGRPTPGCHRLPSEPWKELLSRWSQTPGLAPWCLPPVHTRQLSVTVQPNTEICLFAV